MHRVLGLLLTAAAVCGASDILFISTVASHSHSLWCNKLAEALARRGHKVTLLDTLPPKKRTENLTIYHLEGAYDVYASDLPDYQDLSIKGTPKLTTDLLNLWNVITCKAVMFSPTFKKFINDHIQKTKPFDLLIHDMTTCENFYGIVHLLDIPKVMGVSAMGEPAHIPYIMQVQQNIFHSPYHLSPYTNPMTYIESLENAFYSLYFEYYYRKHIEELDKFSKEIFGKSTPYILDIARSTSVVLINSHPLMDGAKHFGPNVVQIGGFHIDEPNKLEAETQAFLDGAEHGAIYFSLGSNFLSSLMSKEKIQMFLNVFKNLKQRVLWKFEDSSITDVPKNVLISKWFRQSDVLAHPNIKIFISHAGMLGTQEAVYNGVPMITMPFIIDQHFLSQRLMKKGVSVPLQYYELTESKLQEAIHLILSKDSYTIEMKRLSSIFKDRPTKPKDLALYWIEYVLRHDDIKFLKTPETYLNVVEWILMDIKTILGIIIGAVIAIILSIATKSKISKKKYKKN